MKQVIQALQQQGWPETDIHVYITVLQHAGGITASEIRKTTKIVKSTCGYALRRLIKRGLLIRIVKDDLTVLYKANSPQVLLSDLEKRRKSIQDAVTAIQKLRKAKK